MDIVIDRQAQKQLRRTPKNIIEKLRDWVVKVTQHGLQEVAKQPGYHDEPLTGKRKGQRSIRLSRLWRAIYSPFASRISIQTVTPHDYRVHGAAEVPALPFLNQLLGDEPAASEASTQATMKPEKRRTGGSMQPNVKRQVIATLIKAGRRDLAEQFVKAKGPHGGRWGWGNVHKLAKKHGGKQAPQQPQDPYRAAWVFDTADGMRAFYDALGNNVNQRKAEPNQRRVDVWF